MLCRALISLSFLLLMTGCVTGKSGLGASESMRSTEARGETASSMSAPPDGSSGVASTQAKAHTKPAEVALRYPPLPRPWLGIEMQATAPEQGGVELVRIFRGSPAAKAGLLAGDQLL